MNGILGIHNVESLAKQTTCPHIIDGRKCDGKDCIIWKYGVPHPELDASGDVVMHGEGWICGFDESMHLVANAQTKGLDMSAEILDTLERSLDYILSEAENRNYDPPAPTDLVADLEYAIAQVSDAINNGKG